MPILLARVDDRMIHGQVTVGWSRFFSITQIVVISDELAGDSMQESLLGMAVPEGIVFSLFSTKEAAEKLQDESFVKPNTILLTSSIEEYRKLILDEGFPLAEINIGGLRYPQGGLDVCEGVRLTEKDLAAVDALAAHGVKIEVRTVPSTLKVDLLPLLKEKR